MPVISVTRIPELCSARPEPWASAPYTSVVSASSCEDDWAFLIDQPDRDAAFGGYRAATLMLLKRSLRNGQASVDHSLEHRAPEDRLIPKAQWQKERARFVRNLAVSAKPEATIRWILDQG